MTLLPKLPSKLVRMSSHEHSTVDVTLRFDRQTPKVDVFAGMGSQFDTADEAARLEELESLHLPANIQTSEVKCKTELVTVVSGTYVAIIVTSTDILPARHSTKTYGKGRQRTTALCNLPHLYKIQVS